MTPRSGVATRPDSMPPPPGSVEAAMADLPETLNDCPNAGGVSVRAGEKAVTYWMLRKGLAGRGHPLAAAEWAIHQHVEQGRLTVEPGLVGLPGIFRPGEPLRGGGTARTYDRNQCCVRSTPALLEWWHAGARAVPRESVGSPDPAGGASRVPPAVLRPDRARPADQMVEDAARDVPVLLNDSDGARTVGADEEGNPVREISYRKLIDLGAAKRGPAAFQWAVFDLVERGRLAAFAGWKPDRVRLSEVQSRKEAGLPPLPRQGEFSEHPSYVVLRSTPALWAERGSAVAPPAPPAGREPVPPASEKAKGKDINGRMLTLLADDLTRYDWSARQFAERLGCRGGTVKGTKAWKQVMAYRAATEAERIARTGKLDGGRRKRG